jgi:glutaminyl-tRNA synthetase
MNAYYIACTGVVKDAAGRVVELRAVYDPATRGGSADGRKVKGTIHWVSAEHALPAEVRLYDYLFTKPNPQESDDESDEKSADRFLDNLNPDSLRIVDALVEPSLASARPGDKFQFVRDGYFCVDPDTEGERLVFNRTVSLKDTWVKGK